MDFWLKMQNPTQTLQFFNDFFEPQQCMELTISQNAVILLRFQKKSQTFLMLPLPPT
jgi:hypothetical protein